MIQSSCCESAWETVMRGGFNDQGTMFSYISSEDRIPAEHPLREVRQLVREILRQLNRSFGRLYSREGRPSIPPEQLLSALLLQVFYGIRSERQLMEQLDYNLLYRWYGRFYPSLTRRPAMRSAEVIRASSITTTVANIQRACGYR